MRRADFDKLCGALKGTTNVVQWGNASVWKIGAKIFAICSHWGEGGHDKISFKCSDLSYTILREQDGIIPAPYLARAKWVQIETLDAMSEEDIASYIGQAYSIISAKLTRAVRKDLGIG